jgi:hypothetical protein
MTHGWVPISEQEIKSTGALKAVDDAREERKQEVQAYYQQQELKRTSGEVSRAYT